MCSVAPSNRGCRAKQTVCCFLRLIADRSAGLRGFFGLFGIVTFSVNRGDFAAHGAQIGGELSAMVDGVVQVELKVGDGGQLESSAKVESLGELVASEA